MCEKTKQPHYSLNVLMTTQDQFYCIDSTFALQSSVYTQACATPTPCAAMKLGKENERG